MCRFDVMTTAYVIFKVTEASMTSNSKNNTLFLVFSFNYPPVSSGSHIVHLCRIILFQIFDY